MTHRKVLTVLKAMIGRRIMYIVYIIDILLVAESVGLCLDCVCVLMRSADETDILCWSVRPA